MTDTAKSQPPKAFYTVNETAEFFGVASKRVYEAVKRGSLPSVKLGRLIRIPAAALHKLAQQSA